LNISPENLKTFHAKRAASSRASRGQAAIVTDFIFTPTMAGKWLELLKEIAPRVVRVAMLFNPASATYAEYWLNPFKTAAASFAVEAIAAPVRDRSELESVVAAQAREPNGGLIAMPDRFTDAHRVEITSLAARYRLPAIYPFRFLRRSRRPDVLRR
jgi:putative ABC transport system substrate-binding protein